MKIKIYLLLVLIFSSMITYAIDQRTLANTLSKKFGKPIDLGYDNKTKSVYYSWKYDSFEVPDSINSEITSLMEFEPSNVSAKKHEKEVTTVIYEWRDEKMYVQLIYASGLVNNSLVVLVTVISTRIK